MQTKINPVHIHEAYLQVGNGLDKFVGRTGHANLEGMEFML